MPYTLLAEWHPQEAVILAWPDSSTDWAPWLAEVRSVYKSLIKAINEARCAVILLIKPQDIPSAKTYLKELESVVLVSADYNDTWVRDYAFLTLSDGEKNKAVEFKFNGWGNKFDASKDNAVNQNFLANLLVHPVQAIPIVCEGGAIEIDGQGNLLSTSLCLLNPQRNGDTSKEDYAKIFSNFLGAKTNHFFEHGHLIGDDTDGHIDTLVRFTPDHGIVIQTAFNRGDDPHFSGLENLKNEVEKAFPDHQIFTLPLPKILNEDGERLPASYANFLICNDYLLCPVYQCEEDEAALALLSQAFPRHTILDIDCSVLIRQFGSLHCITMQVPVGTLKQTITQIFSSGVREL